MREAMREFSWEWLLIGGRSIDSDVDRLGGTTLFLDVEREQGVLDLHGLRLRLGAVLDLHVTVELEILVGELEVEVARGRDRPDPAHGRSRRRDPLRCPCGRRRLRGRDRPAE